MSKLFPSRRSTSPVCIPPLGALALVVIMPGALAAQTPASRASKKPGPAPTLAGSAWEVHFPASPKAEVSLYRFDVDGRFRSRSLRGVFIFNQSARWKAEGTRFDISVPKVNWKASGTFTPVTIKGTIKEDGKETTFAGRRVDPDTYEFPLDEGEARVTVKLRHYTLGRWPRPEALEAYLKKADASSDRPIDKFSISGFIFEVVEPKGYRGKYITAHHDGLLASGDATEIAKPGQLYVMRLDKKEIGDVRFGICSVDLRLKPATDKRPLGPLISGLWFLTR